MCSLALTSINTKRGQVSFVCADNDIFDMLSKGFFIHFLPAASVPPRSSSTSTGCLFSLSETPGVCFAPSLQQLA